MSNAKNLILFFLLGAVLLLPGIGAYSVVPEDKESMKHAHERVFEAFTNELRSLKLNPTALIQFRNLAKKVSIDQRKRLDGIRWPSYYETIFQAQESWSSGPRPTRMSLNNLKIIYADLLHYAYYLQFAAGKSKVSKTFMDHIRALRSRAKEAMVLDSLRDQDGEEISVLAQDREEILDQYVLEEVVQYLVFCMETVVSLGWEILERNWHPESFWPENLKKIGGRIIYEISDRDTLRALEETNSYPAPILLIAESSVGTPDLRIHLTKKERSFFLKHFLSLKLPISTSRFVSRLNRKFNYREKLRLRRQSYLEKKSFDEKSFDNEGTEFLSPDDLN